MNALTTLITSHLRQAWRRHCEIIRLTYGLDASHDRAVQEQAPLQVSDTAPSPIRPA